MPPAEVNVNTLSGIFNRFFVSIFGVYRRLQGIRAVAAVLFAVLAVSTPVAAATAVGGPASPAAAGGVTPVESSGGTTDARASAPGPASSGASDPGTSSRAGGGGATDRDCDGTVARHRGSVGAGSSERTRVSFTAAVEGDCGIRVTLRPSDGRAPGADLDLYATLDGRGPTADDYDRRAVTAGAVESVELGADQLNGRTTVGVAVVAYTGSANVTVTVERVPPDGERTQAGQSRDTTVVWRGFRHAWSYNHRASRIGSWVDVEDCDDTDCSYAVGHGGASGAGADRASFRDAYTELSARGVGFEAGSVEFDVHGTEKKPGPRSQLVEGTRVVTLPANGTLADRDDYVALVNGFNLQAEGVPMKFVRLHVEVTDPHRVDGKLRFGVRYRALLDCDTPECPGLVGGRATDVDYSLRVNYLVVGGDRATMSVAAPGEVSERYDWAACRNNPIRSTAWFAERGRHDRGIDQFPNSVFPGNHMNCENSEDREIHHEDHVSTRTVETGAGYGIAVPGIRGFTLRLHDGEAHYTQYDTVVGGSYDRSGGSYDLRTLAFFKEWSSRPGRAPGAWGALGHEGSATVSVDPVVLGFGRGCKRSFVHGGGIDFRTEYGNETSPSHPAASVESSHRFQYGTGWPTSDARRNGCTTAAVSRPGVVDSAFWVDVWNERLPRVAPGQEVVDDPTRFRNRHTARFYNESE